MLTNLIFGRLQGFLWRESNKYASIFTAEAITLRDALNVILRSHDQSVSIHRFQECFTELEQVQHEYDNPYILQLQIKSSIVYK